jgi:CRP/FNR family transcriptional regulator, anaerobic regulatory protein
LYNQEDFFFSWNAEVQLVKPQQDLAEAPCTSCAGRESICHALAGKSGLSSSSKRVEGTHQTAHAGQLIYRSNEPVDGVSVLCEGWAFTFLMLFDGRRQILSFLLPGDVIATTALLRDRLSLSIQALTDLRYCRFSKPDLRSLMAAEPKVFDQYASICAAEKEETDQLVTDLGRRTADERIARLVLALRTRLGARGLLRDDSFAFPLRQRHIADATGLTPVHVSRVIGSFRNAGLIEITGRQLKVLNLDELRRVSNTR